MPLSSYGYFRNREGVVRNNPSQKVFIVTFERYNTEITPPKLRILPKRRGETIKKEPPDWVAPCFYGGGHGTRTHGAVTPYLISNQAP